MLAIWSSPQSTAQKLHIWHRGSPTYSKRKTHPNLGQLTVATATHSTFIYSVFIIRSWNELQELIKNIDPHMTPTYKYGFYSSHTVCLPKFFPNPKVDASWAYSLFMILINFFAFFFIAIGYGLMYRWISENSLPMQVFSCYAFLRDTAKTSSAIKGRESLKLQRSKQNSKLQGKLSRIVISDFFCWMPVSLMAFCQLAGLIYLWLPRIIQNDWNFNYAFRKEYSGWCISSSRHDNCSHKQCLEPVFVFGSSWYYLG